MDLSEIKAQLHQTVNASKCQIKMTKLFHLKIKIDNNQLTAIHKSSNINQVSCLLKSLIKP